VRLRVRAYRQGAADFWRERYDVAARHVSADRELSTFWDAGGGAKAALRLGPLVLDAKADVVYYRFQDYARLEGRLAVVGELGATVAW
jgi:hypothetical protein